MIKDYTEEMSKLCDEKNDKAAKKLTNGTDKRQRLKQISFDINALLRKAQTKNNKLSQTINCRNNLQSRRYKCHHVA